MKLLEKELEKIFEKNNSQGKREKQSFEIVSDQFKLFGKALNKALKSG